MKTCILNGTILDPENELTGYHILVEDGLIKAINPGALDNNTCDEIIDARNLKIIPGMIDIHTHGAMGMDTMDASQEALATMARFYARHGVTSFLPTTLAASKTETMAAITAVQDYQPENDGAQILGIHLEGPYLDEQYCGAQPIQFLRKPDPREYHQWFESGVVKLITVAPEMPGAMEMISQGAGVGIRFAVGHSQASLEQMHLAVKAGLDQATHFFNGMPSLHHRNPGIVGAVLSDDRIYAQLILDGNHVHPTVIKIAVKAKGVSKILLITDSIRAAGMNDGEYLLGSEMVEVKDGVARTSKGGLAGSTLTMDAGLRNLVKFTGDPLSQALTTATSNPALAMGMKGKKGVLAPGADADIVLMDEEFNIHLTMVGGRTVYRYM